MSSNITADQARQTAEAAQRHQDECSSFVISETRDKIISYCINGVERESSKGRLFAEVSIPPIKIPIDHFIVTKPSNNQYIAAKYQAFQNLQARGFTVETIEATQDIKIGWMKNDK